MNYILGFLFAQITVIEKRDHVAVTASIVQTEVKAPDILVARFFFLFHIFITRFGGLQSWQTSHLPG